MRGRSAPHRLELLFLLIFSACLLMVLVYYDEETPVEQDEAASLRQPSKRTRCDLAPREANVTIETGFESIDKQVSYGASRRWLGRGCPINFTLTTQTTPERLWMLKWICQRWRGPIVVSVYAKDFGKITKEPACGERVEYAVLAAQSIWAFKKHNNFPVNKLRNLAISRVKTSHFLMSDVDLWPDSHLLERLETLSLSSPELFRDTKNAFVVPAFSREVKTACTSSTASSDSMNSRRMAECDKEAGRMPTTYGRLRECIRAKECHIFDRYNHDGHGTTDYGAWLKQELGALRPIRCFLSNRYEPYVVLAASSHRPQFEEKFTGYGKNKIQNLVHLRYAGWKFSVLSRSFLTHFPHHKSAARIEWETPSSALKTVDEHRLRMDTLYRRFLDTLIAVYGSPGVRQNATRICS